jgi:site-specific recombinase XerD
MSPRTKVKQEWSLASVALRDAYTDFILSRQAMRCSPATLEFYKYTAGKFLLWLEQHGITSPYETQARHVREYLAELVGNGKSDNTVHDNARAIKTLLRLHPLTHYLHNAEGGKEETPLSYCR